jgi:large subunit ribosomal protein L20
VRALDANCSYSRFMNGLRLKNVDINRKVLAELAVNNADEFARLLELAKS